MNNNEIINKLEFGKCIFEQKEKIESLMNFMEVPLEHAFDCPLINKNLGGTFIQATEHKIKNIKLASVGIIFDKEVE